MWSNPTVFVLGAGSSVEFGLPTGTGLMEDIHRRLSLLSDEDRNPDASNSQIIGGIDRTEYTDNQIRRTIRNMQRGLLQFNSIDDFLHTHSDDELITNLGKLAIARAISVYESKSFIGDFWKSRESAFETYRRTWASMLVTSLVTGMRAIEPEAVFRDIAIVNFNYDRCIEAVLYHTIQPALRLSQENAATLMKTLRVVRPYGGLGPLAFDEMNGVAFGGKNVKLQEMAARIRVYTEKTEDSSVVVKIKQILQHAQTIVFLGFGFHRQNMEILDIQDYRSSFTQNSCRVFATACGLSRPGIDIVHNRISQAIKPESLVLGNTSQTCREFLDDHRLMFGG